MPVKLKITVLMILITILCPFNIKAEEIQAPDVKALGAVLIDGKSGRVLWGKNADEPLANASTTKIMTCIIALESGKRDETVCVSQNAAAQPETRMGLSEGEQIKLNDLLYALMLQSSNDAAVAVAEHISGSVEDFCVLMNEKAAELGARDTCFETPNGLDRGNHHSTAYDMAVIARDAMENEDFVKLINTRNISIESNRHTYSVRNKNRLLSEYEGALGIKTGFTGKAGNCFVGAAERDGMLLISVVLGSGWGSVGKQRKWIDTKNLLNYGFNNYEYFDICVKGEHTDILPVTSSYGRSVGVETAGDIRLPLNKAEREALYAEIELPDTVEAPVQRGDKIGRIVFKTDSDTVIAECPLVAENDVKRKDFKTTSQMLIKYWINPMKSAILKYNV